MSDELNQIPGNLTPDPSKNPVVKKLEEAIQEGDNNQIVEEDLTVPVSSFVYGDYHDRFGDGFEDDGNSPV